MNFLKNSRGPIEKGIWHKSSNRIEVNDENTINEKFKQKNVNLTALLW